MAVFKCKMCGGDLYLRPNQTVAECEYCGSMQTVPAADNEKKMTMFARANRLRADCEFDKAAGVYEAIAAEFPEEPECNWGLVLCKYGIEYVDDSLTGRKIPTCHRTLTGSVLEDNDFLTAVRKSDADSAALYRREAEDIDIIQKKIHVVVAKETPYDVFICYKETDNVTGKRTQDSVIGQDIYTELSREGYRVFYARISLKSVAGSEYEPHIYAALSSAKVMLVLGSQYDYFQAVWVRNEWGRYLEMMKQHPHKVLIPCYRDIDAYDMPREFRNLQALDMADMMFYPTLKDNVQRVIQRKTAGKTHIVSTGAEGSSIWLEGMIKRAYVFLGGEEWDKALQYSDKVLDLEPEYAEAYMVRLLSLQHLKTREDLIQCQCELEKDRDFLYYLKFAAPEDQETARQYAQEAERNRLYKEAVDLGESGSYEKMEEAIELLDKLGSWNDADALRQTYIVQRKNLIYTAACAALDDKYEYRWDKAAKLFDMIPGWMDADVRKLQCAEKRMNHSLKEALRLKNKPIRKVSDDADDKEKARAIKWKLDDYNKAIEILEQLLPDEKAEREIAECRTLKCELVYQYAVSLMDRDSVDDLQESASTFELLDGWKDSRQLQLRCYEDMLAIFNGKWKKIAAIRKAYTTTPLKILIMVLLVVLGVLFMYNPDFAASILPFAEHTGKGIFSLGTLLLATPVFAYMGYWYWTIRVEEKNYYLIRFRPCLIGYLICLIPVRLIWGFLISAGNSSDFGQFICTLVRFGLVAISALMITRCVTSWWDERENMKELTDISDDIQENIDICIHNIEVVGRKNEV